MERTAPIAAMRYLIQSGIPIRCDVACAIDFVFLIAFAAHANSVAKIPSPASKTKIPGPGANRKIVPSNVTNPPTTPMNTLQTSDP